MPAVEVAETTPPVSIVISDIAVSPNEWMTLAATVSFATDRDASVIIRDTRTGWMSFDAERIPSLCNWGSTE